tara:strand:- start:40 stop:231 length:192 start_codon:yes stop_codon:yes gene_type:complete
MDIPRTISFLEKEEETIEERFESIVFRLYYVKDNIKNKIKLLKMSKCSLRTYIRVHYLLGEPI